MYTYNIHLYLLQNITHDINRYMRCEIVSCYKSRKKCTINQSLRENTCRIIRENIYVVFGTNKLIINLKHSDIFNITYCKSYKLQMLLFCIILSYIHVTFKISSFYFELWTLSLWLAPARSHLHIITKSQITSRLKREEVYNFAVYYISFFFFA